MNISQHFSSVFLAAAYEPKNETVYYDWSYLQMQIIQGHSQHLRLSQRTTSSIFAESYIHLYLKYL